MVVANGRESQEAGQGAGATGLSGLCPYSLGFCFGGTQPLFFLQSCNNEAKDTGSWLHVLLFPQPTDADGHVYLTLNSISLTPPPSPLPPHLSSSPPPLLPLPNPLPAPSQSRIISHSLCAILRCFLICPLSSAYQCICTCVCACVCMYFLLVPPSTSLTNLHCTFSMPSSVLSITSRPSTAMCPIPASRLCTPFGLMVSGPVVGCSGVGGCQCVGGCDALVVWSNWITYVFVDCTNWPSPTVRGPVHLVDTHTQTQLGVCVCAYNWVCVATLNAPVGLGDTK